MSASPSPDAGAAAGAVLVVEDEPTVRELTVMMLQRGGYDTMEAPDGLAAVQLVRERAGDIGVVLLDVMMPGMTGHEALPAIRELAPEMPVVFFSGYDQDEVAQHLEGAEVHTSFLAKPFDRDGLLAAVAEAKSAAASRAG